MKSSQTEVCVPQVPLDLIGKITEKEKLRGGKPDPPPAFPMHERSQSRQTTNRRPLSVTVIGWLFIAAGAIGFVYHLTEFTAQFEYRLILVLLVRLIAILSGFFMLRGRNWARWLLLVWIAYHVILSSFHSQSQLAMHVVLFVVVGYFLFRTRASAYFRGTAHAAQERKRKSAINRKTTLTNTRG